MKIVNIIACGFLLCLSTWTGLAQALEKPTAVKAENIDSPQAVLSSQNQNLVVEFQIRDIPKFNRYETRLGEEAISAELAPLQEARATWLIVMDTSDPGGRRLTIEQQKHGLARFLSFVSPSSRVGLYRLSRELVRVGTNIKDELPLGIGMSQPILVSAKGGLAWNPVFQAVPALFPAMDKNDNSQMNTNLWVGLLRLLREELPRLASGHYANLPKGILLISDGVDESATGSSDLAALIQEARKLGVPIHTLAYAHKDGKKTDIVSRHRGFSYLQRLSSETGGRSLSYDMFMVDHNSAHQLQSIVNSTEAALLNLSFPMNQLKSGQDITLQIYEGQQTLLGRLNISQYDVAQVLGDYHLHILCALTNKTRQAEGDDLKEATLNLGIYLIQNIASLPIRNELFAYTDVDEPFARRIKQILAHLDENPELMKRAREKTNEGVRTLIHLGAAIINFGAPLPEAAKESVAPQQPIIINNSTPTGPNSDQKEDESLQDWVWWSLGIGGSALAILFFWLITRIINRQETPIRVISGGQTDEDPYTGPTKPVLASLVNTANPAQSWVVSNTSCRVGRHSGNEISLPFSYVSGVQFILSRNTSGQWQLRDAQSTNGTMVNGKKVSTAQLNIGDIIRIADLELEFKLR